MGRKSKAKRSSAQKTMQTQEVEKLEIRTKGTAKHNNSTVDKNSFEHVKKKDEQKESASSLVGMVTGIVGGTAVGALVSPVGMVLGGPIGGIGIGAVAAGLSGVAVQEVFSKHIPQVEWLLLFLGVLFLPILVYFLASETAAFKTDLGGGMPRRFVLEE